MKTIDYGDALNSLVPNKKWILRGTDSLAGLEWSDESAPPTAAELQAEIARLQEEWNATEYQRKRQPEYPPLAELADAIYWQAEGDATKMTAYLAKVEAVKTKYPKGV